MITEQRMLDGSSSLQTKHHQPDSVTEQRHSNLWKVRQ